MKHATVFSLTWMGGPGPFHILCLDFVLVSVLPKGSWIQWKSWKLDHCLISFLSGQKPQLKLSDPKDDWRACADSKTHLQQPRQNRHVKPARLLSSCAVRTGRYDAFSQSLSPSPASFLEFSGTIEMTHATSLSRKKNLCTFTLVMEKFLSWLGFSLRLALCRYRDTCGRRRARGKWQRFVYLLF